MPKKIIFKSVDEVKAYAAEHSSSVIVCFGKDVLDISGFMENHPGGPDVFAEYGVAEDITEGFKATGHSEAARMQVYDYRIGAIEA